MSFKLQCIKCNNIFPFSINTTTCPYHNPRYGYLQIVYENSALINKPLPINKILVDLGQVITPIIKAGNFAQQVGLNNLFIKDESRNPTGSFKDRENFIFFNYLLENKIKKNIFVISSGNAAVSTAAYANKSGYGCLCYLPSNTSQSKKSLIKLYEGKIVTKEGKYEAIYNFLITNKPVGINATPGICPIKEEGDKLISYEILEQLGVPDKIFVPCGNGTLLWSIYKGFKELKISGKIEKLPQMMGVQIIGGDPLAKAFVENKDYVVLKSAPSSIAEGIIATESYSSPKTIQAIKETGGEIISVSDKEILEAHQQIIKLESIVPELTSSSVYAAIRKSKFNKTEVVVCINTGSGLKDVNDFVQMSVD